jgi:hypothetical protein
MLVQLTESEHRTIIREELAALVAELHPAKPAPALIDRQSLAEQLSICAKTLDRLRNEPEFPELRVGDSPRFELAAVLAWIKSNRTGLRLVGAV